MVSLICKAQHLVISLILFGLIKQTSKVFGTEQIQFIVVRAPEFSCLRTLCKLKMQNFKICEVKNYIQDVLIPKTTYSNSTLSFILYQNSLNSLGKVYCM